MKILDIPQSGKRGLNVSVPGQFGQVSRALAIPANPRTPAQMEVRNTLKRVSARWRALEEAQRTAWVAASRSGEHQDGPVRGRRQSRPTAPSHAFRGEGRLLQDATAPRALR